MEITTDDSLMMLGSTSGAFISRGMATVMPCCRKGVTTMKMIKSTNMISTIGVTLISDERAVPPPDDIPITKTPCYLISASGRATFVARLRRSFLDRSLPLRLQLLRAILNEIVDQLRSRVIHLDDKAINFPSEVVKQPHSRHSHQQAQRRRKQSLGNAAGDRCNTRRLCILHALEGVDDPEHRSEQADERSRRSDRRQAGQAPPKLSGLNSDGALQSALRCFDLVA